MTNNLRTAHQTPISGPMKRRPKGLPRRSRVAAKAGWTPERRAKQAQRIRLWQPWQRSTGPRTERGKARVAINPLKHGGRSRAHILEMRRVRYALRLAAYNVARLRAFIRLRRLASASPARETMPHIVVSPPKIFQHGTNERARDLADTRFWAPAEVD